MLIVKIDVVHLEVFERLFTSLPYVVRISFSDEPILSLVEVCPEFGTNEYPAPEIRILKQCSQKSLIVALLHSRTSAARGNPQSTNSPSSIRKPRTDRLLSNGCESTVPLTLDVSMKFDPSSTACKHSRDRARAKID